MTKWEYLHIVFTNETANMCSHEIEGITLYKTSATDALAVLGSSGWELVNVCRFEVQTSGVYEMFFKRLKE